MCQLKNYQNTMPFDKVIAKIERVQFLPHNVLDSDNIFFQFAISVINFRLSAL